MDDSNLEEVQKSVRIFRVLSDESRVRILWLLIEKGGHHVSDIAETLELSQSNVSHHLSLLELLGFVSKKRDPDDGRKIHYWIDDECIEDILRRTRDHVLSN
jgi:DNA-binding MarR family transcriptional regulator